MTKKEKSKNQKPLQPAYSIVFGIFLVIVLLAGALFGYGYAYQEKILLNTYLHGKNVATKDRDELKAIIEQAVKDYPDKKLAVNYQDKKWEINFDDFGWKLDNEKTIDQVMAYGHQSDFIAKYLDLAHSVVRKRDFGLLYEFNESTLLDWISGINAEIGQSKKETNIVIKKGEAKITDPAPGKKINDDDIKQQVLKHLVLKSSGEIKAELIEDQPVITKDEAQGLIERAKELAGHEVEIVGPNESIKISSDKLGTSIKLKKKLEKKGFLRSELGPAYVSFDEEEVKDILQENLNELNIAAVDAKFTISAGQITLTSPSKTGKEIKMEESLSLIVDKLEQGQSKITLPSKVQEPSISAQSSADIQKIGIKELIGTATTDFRKSPSNRVHNIETGVKYISGAILKPAEEFSTVKRLGSIDQAGGYLPELVIKENETTPEFGGGLCQVSTTLFRAAMQSGLKITERHNHSYRVSYYEPPVGMDATIYSPRPDFKFVNDTDSHILIYGHIEGTKITFDIYGTKDGRQVEITDPTVYDITDPPEPIYKDDPSLEPGEIRQTDKAHPGAKAVFYYRVKKGGKLVSEDKFVSSYVAWPAKYLRGPQVESTPAPTQ